MALWGMRPEGFAPVVGTRFKFIGKPNRAWRGFVECEVLEVREPSRLSYAWLGNADDPMTRVTYTLEARKDGTRLTLEHSGFLGVRGFMLAKLIMAPGWKQTLRGDFPALLAELDAGGNLRPTSTLVPKF
jgi:uncharacterized protein YndB with AHSA1/START domain